MARRANGASATNWNRAKRRLALSRCLRLRCRAAACKRAPGQNPPTDAICGCDAAGSTGVSESQHLRYRNVGTRSESATLKEIAREQKIPYSTMAGWIERGLVEVPGRTGKSGALVYLGAREIAELQNLARLRRGGLSLQRSCHLIEDLRAAGLNPSQRTLFVVLDRKKGRVLRVAGARTRALEVMGPNKGQYVMVELVADVRGRVVSRGGPVRADQGGSGMSREADMNP